VIDLLDHVGLVSTLRKKDFALRTDFRRNNPQIMRAMGVGYREFQTAMISGIALMLDPQGPDASDMKAVIETFLKDNHGMVDLDDTTRRELKIIEFLRSKSEIAKVSSDASVTSPMGSSVFSGSQGKSHGEDRLHGPPLSSIRHTPIANHKRIGSHSSPLSIVQTENGNNDSPPAASASPAEENNPAQTLLDHWCDNLSNFVPPDLLAGSMDDIQMMPFVGTTDFGQRASLPSYLGSANSTTESNGIEADLSYWETMFNMLPGNTRSIN